MAVLDWLVLALHRRPWDYVCKPAVVVALLAGVGIQLGSPAQGPARFFLPALVLCLLGDVFLLWAKGFLAGLTSFLGAHVCFILGLVQPWRGAWPLGLLGAGVWGLFLGLLLRGFRGPRAWVGPVAAYSLALAGLLIASWNAALQPQMPWASRALTAGGGTLFFASDTLLGLSQFVRPWRGARLQVRVLYHLALLALAGWLLT